MGIGARIWHDDGDQAAEVHGNLALGIDATALAEFWASASPAAILALLDRLDALEAALRWMADTANAESKWDVVDVAEKALGEKQ